MEHTRGHVGAVGPLPRRSGPLTDVRVIDLTAALSGPFCTMLLADLGADVIKVEPPTGDFTRSGGPFTAGDTERNYGGYFPSVNRSKRSIVLDLQQESDRDTLKELVRGADVVVENFRVGVLDRLGIGYDDLAAINPRIVYGAVRGFGDPRTGESPYATWPAFDVVDRAMSGLVASTGEPGSFGTRVGPSIGDTYPATLLALGIVSAVHEARRSGAGQFVDVAMYDSLSRSARRRCTATAIGAVPMCRTATPTRSTSPSACSRRPTERVHSLRRPTIGRCSARSSDDPT